MQLIMMQVAVKNYTGVGISEPFARKSEVDCTIGELHTRTVGT